MDATPEPAAAGTFRPLGASDRQLPGYPAILLCGASPVLHASLLTLLAAQGLAHLPVVAVSAAQSDRTLAALSAAPPTPAAEHDAPLETMAIVMSGLREHELNVLMQAYRLSGLPRLLWAMVTPANAHWTARALLTELSREREALRTAMAAKASPTPESTP